MRSVAGDLRSRTSRPVLESDGRRFHNTTFAAGLPVVGKSHGVNIADLAGDERMHVLVASGGAYPGDLLTVNVYRPATLPGHDLNVRLTGSRSNRDAIGSRLVRHAGGRQQHGLVSGGSQFGCLPFEQHFGLGTADRADALEIWWPAGPRQRIAPVPVDAMIRILEGEDRWTEVYPRRPALAGARTP